MRDLRKPLSSEVLKFSQTDLDVNASEKEVHTGRKKICYVPFSAICPCNLFNATSIYLFNVHKKSPGKGGEVHTKEKCVASKKLNVKEPCLLLMGV